jgi:RNA polymerase sigma factor (sigma-70 family)
MANASTRFGPLIDDVERWWHCFGRILTRASHRSARRREMIEDAIQQLWVHLLVNPPPPEVVADPGRLFAWLLGATRRRVLDSRRREWRRHEVPLVVGAQSTDNVPAWIGTQEDYARVRSILAALDSNRGSSAAKILELRYIEDRSVSEIGKLLGLTPRQVSARLQRAKRQFRRVWRSAGGGARGSNLGTGSQV